MRTIRIGGRGSVFLISTYFLMCMHFFRELLSMGCQLTRAHASDARFIQRYVAGKVVPECVHDQHLHRGSG